MATFIQKRLGRRQARRRQELSLVEMARFERTCAALDRVVRSVDAQQA